MIATAERRTGTPLSTPHRQATKNHPKPVKPADLLSRPPELLVCPACLVHSTRHYHAHLISPSIPRVPLVLGNSFHSSPLDPDLGYTFHTASGQRESRQPLGLFRSRAFQPETRVPRPPSQQERHKFWTANLRPAGFLLGVLGLGRLSRLFSRPAQNRLALRPSCVAGHCLTPNSLVPPHPAVSFPAASIHPPFCCNIHHGETHCKTIARPQRVPSFLRLHVSPGTCISPVDSLQSIL